MEHRNHPHDGHGNTGQRTSRPTNSGWSQTNVRSNNICGRSGKHHARIHQRNQTTGAAIQQRTEKPRQPARKNTKPGQHSRLPPTTDNPTKRHHRHHTIPTTRHRTTNQTRRKRTNTRNRSRTLARNIPPHRRQRHPRRHHSTPRPGRQTHVHQPRPSTRRRHLHHQSPRRNPHIPSNQHHRRRTKRLQMDRHHQQQRPRHPHDLHTIRRQHTPTPRHRNTHHQPNQQRTTHHLPNQRHHSNRNIRMHNHMGIHTPANPTQLQ